MKTYKFVDQDGAHTLTEQDILDSYFSYWSEQMCNAGLERKISPELCIEDWVAVNWAWEI